MNQTVDDPRIKWGKIYAKKARELVAPSSALNTPFTRQIDLWYLAVAYGIYKCKYHNKKISEIPNTELEDIVSFREVTPDPELKELLDLITIVHTGDIKRISTFTEVIGTANQYAYIGIENLFVDMDGSGFNTPLEKIEEVLTKIATSTLVD